MTIGSKKNFRKIKGSIILNSLIFMMFISLISLLTFTINRVEIMGVSKNSIIKSYSFIEQEKAETINECQRVISSGGWDYKNNKVYDKFNINYRMKYMNELVEITFNKDSDTEERCYFEIINLHEVCKEEDCKFHKNKNGIVLKSTLKVADGAIE